MRLTNAISQICFFKIQPGSEIFNWDMNINILFFLLLLSLHTVFKQTATETTKSWANTC